MRGEPTIFDEPHHHALERLAAQALSEKDYDRAFELSDRRCRIAPAPQSHCFVLRSEASFRLGQKRYAIADLERATEITPNDPQANRRILAWAKGPRQLAAARSLLSSERDVEVLRHAIDVLREHGRATFAAVTVLDATIEGWAVWDRNAPAEISIASQDNITSSYINPDPSHALNGAQTYAAAFRLARPRSSDPQAISVSVEGDRFFSFRAPGNQPPAVTLSAGAGASDAAPTVIIPIYADFAATKACLQSLMTAMKATSDFRVLLIDDAAPDAKIKRLLRSIATEPGICLLTNARNLGFVGSINRALREVDAGDVILLNSDTIVPPGFIDRLASTARAAPDIGTVMPLSNNGEFSSFPKPHQSNPLGTLDSVILLDQIAASANAGMAVDVPSGIGFCLYITRACLNAVGQLSENYQRGYLEDVDFCLRARELGFRSVCAASVFVGHEGSRSFGAEKRSLVVRNLDVLDRKFPYYRNECSAFVMADPLRPFRETIERLLPRKGDNPRLIVTGPGAIAAVALARARQLSAQEQPAMILQVGPGANGLTARPIDPDGAAPQNVGFDIADAAELRLLDAYLTRLAPSRIEIMDPAGTPAPLLERLLDGRVPYDMFLADAGLLFPRGLSSAEMISELDLLPLDLHSTAERKVTEQSWRQRWRAVAEKAERLIAPCPMSAALARRHFPKLKITKLDVSTDRPHKPGKAARKLGIIPLRTSAEEMAKIQALARALHVLSPELQIVVVGETLDDVALMKGGNTFVTGRIESDDLGRVLTQYHVGFLLYGLGQPLFGHPFEAAARATGLPIAHWDWSNGHCRLNRGDKAIDPALADAAVADLLVHWLGSRVG